ncbi:alpha/beta hydrolase [Nocardioides sp. Iso805N]|uniref:alpha/beta hydrolase n=1 Tax=Nocardioides sp. Iso805N TaxID=1283287 RepID=UPI000377DF8F|nr:alpha/beta hydrolase [Nocardioides sp. Iso805N]
MRGHTLRQAALAVLTANAVRPLNSEATAVPAFAAGWITGELAPQLLLAGLADTAVAVARRRATPLGLALAAATTAGLGYLTWRASGTGAAFKEVLDETLSAVDPEPTLHEQRDARTSLRTLARPFALADPRVEVIRDIPYTKGGVKARLDVYRRRENDAERAAGAPVLVQIHGGAWTIGRKEEQGLLLMNRMAAQGWVCVAINYRLAPRYRWPTQIDDVRNAISWVRDHIAEYGGDPGYLVLTGGSAGGHLAALAALTADPPVAACVPFYGVYDLAGDDPYAVYVRRFLTRRVFADGATIEDFREASPIEHITPDAPDFFVIHGDSDTMVSVRQARAFVERLREVSRAGVTYAELPGAQHAFEIFGSIRAHAAIGAVQQWLEWHREHVGGSTVAD